MELMKIAALVYLIIYYGVLLGLRSYILYRQTGINPVKNMNKEGLAGIAERAFLFCFISISVIVLNYVFIEDNYLWLIPIYYLEYVTVGYIGIVLSAVGLLIAFIAQLQMGKSWRLGLNKNETTPLVLNGFFAYSRNPIYLGILISNIGFFLMMPNALSFAFLVLSYFALELKISLEEQYLEEVHSEAYGSYKSSVPRWI